MRIVIAVLFLSSLTMAQSTGPTLRPIDDSSVAVPLSKITTKSELQKETVTPTPVTDAEKLDLRATQVAFLQANNALKSSPVWAAYQQAQSALDSAITKLYSDRKLKQADWTLCDGPGAPGCDGVAKGDIQLRPIPKPPATKTEEKK